MTKFSMSPSWAAACPASTAAGACSTPTPSPRAGGRCGYRGGAPVCLMDPSDKDAADSFEAHRHHLTGLAYRMLGSLAEAQDVVQEAYLRWHQVDRGNLSDARAFLSRTATRLCLDQLKSARPRNEHYVGPWLPEPVLDEAALAAESAGD